MDQICPNQNTRQESNPTKECEFDCQNWSKFRATLKPLSINKGWSLVY
jgi:hypothetical protein